MYQPIIRFFIKNLYYVCDIIFRLFGALGGVFFITSFMGLDSLIGSFILLAISLIFFYLAQYLKNSYHGYGGEIIDDETEHTNTAGVRRRSRVNANTDTQADFRIKNWSCYKCGKVVESSSVPSAAGCSGANRSHGWVNITGL